MLKEQSRLSRVVPVNKISDYLTDNKLGGTAGKRLVPLLGFRVFFVFKKERTDKVITKEMLKDYARKLMFDMDDNEYKTLQDEFATILKQMELIENIPNIKEIEPLFYPYVSYEAKLRCDEVNEIEMLSVSEVLANTEHQVRDQVKVPRVVDSDEL